MGQFERRQFLVAAGALLVVPISDAQQARKVYRLGLFYSATVPEAELVRTDAPTQILFRRELHKLGYVEGQNLIIERVSHGGQAERYAEAAAEMLRRSPDVIVVVGSQIAVAAKKATSTVPIVMNSAADPVKYGLVASLARPSGNVTGLAADVNPEIEAKRLHFLKQVMPKLSRVSCLVTPWIWEGPLGQAVRAAGGSLGVETLYAEHKPADLEMTFANVTRQRPEALFVVLSPHVTGQRDQIAEYALRSRIPSTHPFAEMVDAGGLMSYGFSLADQNRAAAHYVDKILRGAKPGDLPVEQPSKFELVINLKTAKVLGITIPSALLLQADRVIE